MRNRLAKPLIALALATTVVVLPACSTSKDTAPKSFSEATDRAADRTEDSLVGLTSEQLRNAIDAVAVKSGKKPARITEISLTAESIAIEVVDPKKPDELNVWHVDDDANVESKTTPVDYGGDAEALKQNTFSSTEVSADAIIDAIKKAPTASKVADGKLMGVTVSRNLPTSTKILSSVLVHSPRSSKTVRVDMSGDVVSVF